MNVRLSSESLDRLAADVLFVGLSSADVASPAPALRALDDAFGGQLLPELGRKRFKGGEGSALALPTFGKLAAPALVLVGLGDGGWSGLRSAAGKVGRDARAQRASTAAIAFPSLSERDASRVLECAVAGNYQWQTYKPEDERTEAVGTWILHGSAVTDAASLRGAAVRARWQAWARDLVNAPPADLYPESLAARARELAAIPNVTVEVWDFAKCRAEGLVGIEAVGRGSDKKGVLIHVRYRPPIAKDHVALVGKGVTFDSGGLSIKPSDGMLTMRCDMGGAATMLAATGAAAELGVEVAVDCFAPAVENLLSGDAYKLGDVLRYRNGVTVEIHNTDAEGRLILADALILASQVPGVRTILDAATLTGACVVALGDDLAGLFTENDALAGELLDAAITDGEGLWRMPLHQPYKEIIKTDHAQIKNVGGRAGGAITAALFLQHFVGGDPAPAWAHLDIAGPAFLDKASGRYAAGATGEMVRSLTTFLARRAAR